MRAGLGHSLFRLVHSSRVVFLVALTMRLWALKQLPPGQAWHYFYQYNEFARIAWALVSGHGYSSPWVNTPLQPTAVEPPVYTFLLAGIFELAGAYSDASLWIGTGLNAVISACSAVMILQIGKRDFNTSAACLAAWTWSCWLYEAAASVRLWESSLSALWLLTALWLLPKLRGSLNPRRWLLFGMLAGVAALTSPTTLAVFLPFWVWLWIRHRGQGSSKAVVLTSIAVCILVLAPWTIRNYRVLHRLIPVRDNFGLELWIGNHEGVSHQYPLDFPLLNPSEYNRLGEVAFMESRRQWAITFITHHPGYFLQLSARRVLLFWTAPDHSAWPWVSLLAWVGLLLALRRDRARVVPYAIVMAMFPLVYYVTHTFDTYRHPIEPVILLLAAYAVAAIAEPALQKRRSSFVPASKAAT